MVLCREGIENITQYPPNITLLSSAAAGYRDNICFTFMTSFTLHVPCLHRLPSRNLLRQFDQVRHSKKRSPRRYSHERIRRTGIGPIHRQGMQTTIFRVLKPDPVLAPVLAVGDEFEFLLVQRMVGMGYSETSILSVAMRRI